MPSKVYTIRLSDADAADLAKESGSTSAGVRTAVDTMLVMLREERGLPGGNPAAPDNPAGNPNRPAPTRQQGRKAKAVAITTPDGATAVAEPAAEPPTWRFRSRWCRPCLDAKQPLCRACRHLEQMR